MWMGIASGFHAVLIATALLWVGMSPSWDAIQMELMVPGVLVLCMLTLSGLVLWLTQGSRAPRPRRPRVSERRRLVGDDPLPALEDHGPDPEAAALDALEREVSTIEP